MKGNLLSTKQRRLEQAIVGLSTKAAGALESVRQVRGSMDEAEKLLVDLGHGLEELYLNLSCEDQES